MPERGQLRSYIVVTAAYWGFTLTDGALRMLVLLHFHRLGYTPFELATLFLLYEVFGVVTNLIGGWIGSRAGLKVTLFAGLVLQIGALMMLSALSTDWTQLSQVAYVVVAQGLSGIAKDFTKLSSKSAIKLLVPSDAGGTLFRWVALLTGSKNTLKGAGFFLGGVLLSNLGFRDALWAMAGGLVLVVTLTAALLPGGIGRAKSSVKFSQILSKSRAINIISAARMFLFCARDVWFVVALPVFLSEVSGWSFVAIGTYMAAWVIGYGVVQAMTPRFMTRMGGGAVNDARAAKIWGFVLAVITLGIFGALQSDLSPTTVVVAGLAVFGVVFAINSAVHSYLILAYTDADKVALNVGFYYMANAVGRLIGTILSGLIYQAAGLEACLVTAAGMVIAATLFALVLPDPRTGATAAKPA
jgi:hypothetical protein